MKRFIIAILGSAVLIWMVMFMLRTAAAEPAPNNMHEYGEVVKGAVPGFAKKPVYFSSKLAEEHLRYLYNKKHVRLIISLDHCENVRKVVNKINKDFPGVGLKQICRKVRRSRKHYEKNIVLFEEVASYIGNVKFYIHCRYGAHRAVTVLTGAWVASGAGSFEEAFKRTGGKKRAFRSKGQKQLIGQAKQYAKDFVEPEQCGEVELENE